MIGQEMDAFEELAKEVHAAGHEIGNHTYSHPDLTLLTQGEARGEIKQASERIRRVTGRHPSSFRPPYFAVNEDVFSLAAEFGYDVIGCVNGEAKDWEQPQPGVEYILEQTRATVDNGSIFLFHDGYGDRTQTVEAVRVLVAELADQGYRFVTIRELMELAGNSLLN